MKPTVVRLSDHDREHVEIVRRQYGGTAAGAIRLAIEHLAHTIKPGWGASIIEDMIGPQRGLNKARARARRF